MVQRVCAWDGLKPCHVFNYWLGLFPSRSMIFTVLVYDNINVLSLESMIHEITADLFGRVVLPVIEIGLGVSVSAFLGMFA